MPINAGLNVYVFLFYLHKTFALNFIIFISGNVYSLHKLTTMSKKKNSIDRKVTGALFFLSVLLFSAAAFSQNPLAFSGSAKEIHQLVDSLANQLNKYYVTKEDALKMSSFIKKKCKEGAYDNIKDAHILAGTLTADVLSVHRDEHFHIEYNPQMANELLGNIDDVPKMVSERLKQERYKNFGFKQVEILNGNIGYLEISSFSRLNDFSKATASATLKFLSNTNALIIDLRYGVGGSPEMVNYIIGHFLKTKTHIMGIHIRSENSTLPYYAGGEDANSPLTTLPVYILTSYKTFSAAEGLSYELQSLKRAVIVGETTRGGAHTVTYRPLSSGFITDIPFGNAISPITKTNWELSGVIPDISCSSDNALETAELKIFETALTAVKDSTEKKQLNWQRDLLQSVNHPQPLDTSLLKSLPGKYGSCAITAEHGNLFYQKTGKAKFLMQPMKDNVLKIKGNDTFRVSYFRDSNGNINNISTYYDDGRVEYGSRKKAADSN